VRGIIGAAPIAMKAGAAQAHKRRHGGGGAGAWGSGVARNFHDLRRRQDGSVTHEIKTAFERCGTTRRCPKSLVTQERSRRPQRGARTAGAAGGGAERGRSGAEALAAVVGRRSSSQARDTRLNDPAVDRSSRPSVPSDVEQMMAALPGAPAKPLKRTKC